MGLIEEASQQEFLRTVEELNRQRINKRYLILKFTKQRICSIHLPSLLGSVTT